jgi:sortase A
VLPEESDQAGGTEPIEGVVPPARQPHRVFDRPKQPRDWRWAVGGVGKTLIVIGLLMFAFVAYQLWGTGIYTAQAQSRLEDQFHKLATATTVVAPTTSTTTTTTLTPVTSAPVDSTPTTAGPTTTTMLAGYPFAAPEIGNVLLRIEIPSIGVDKYVEEGVGVQQLADGPGHFPESVLPGQLGNAAIAGHRTTHLAPFYSVDKLNSGDRIIITYPGDTLRFVYSVTGTEIVKATDYAKVVPTVDPNKATLALASCHPIGTANKRIIVHSELLVAESSPLFAPTPVVAATPGALLPDDGSGDGIADTVAGTPSSSVPTSSVPTSSVPSDVIPSSSIPAGSTGAVSVATSVPATVAPTTVSTAAAPAGAGTGASAVASKDAFSQGWFDDSAAWPHIILWGLLLSAIAYGGYRLARRTRRIWLGTLVSAMPFVFVLYFFFENVNRLLPPGL